VKSKAENGSEVEFWALVLEVRCFASMVDLLGVSCFIAATCEVGHHHMRSSMSYLSR
jgi:hypothetical protein